MSNIITLPHEFQPRPYQLDLLKAVDSGYKRAIAIYHRRAGKDKTMFNLLIKKAFERVGVYYYLFPEFAQGKRVIWDGVDGSGFRFMDHIPDALIQNKNGTDMKVTLVNNSIIQIIGTDKFNKVRGANPVGCIFSEFAFQNPKGWSIIRPILAENNGWACFNSTPNGKNHFHDLYQMARNNPNWFTQMITIDDSRDNDGRVIITPEIIQEERDSGMSEEMIQQEYYCSWTANSQGFYYLSYIEDAAKDGRIGKVPFNPSVPVETWWDIGAGKNSSSSGDNTAIWFTQVINKAIHVIDFYQGSGRGLEHYAKVLQKKPYVYRSHNFPHDMRNIEFGSGKTKYEQAEELFKGTRLEVVQKLGLEDGINAVRVTLPLCHFDKAKCKDGLDALRNYHRAYDDAKQEFRKTPVHDWASDPADAFRYFAVGITMPKNKGFRNNLMSTKRRQIKKNWMTA